VSLTKNDIILTLLTFPTVLSSLTAIVRGNKFLETNHKKIKKDHVLTDTMRI